MKQCNLCPRSCRVDRLNGEKGFCGESMVIRVARASLHMWEEPCISSVRGSGTVFFAGCPLHCVYCQNQSIANGSVGREITVDRLAEIFIEQQQRGAHNINLVTPTHFIPQIAKAIALAKSKGMNLPIVYNTGSYENAEALKMLEGLIDVYLPDLKYMSSVLSERYSHAPDYFKTASAAIEEMYAQVGEPQFQGDIMTKGMIVRHLMLPGCIGDSQNVVRYLYDTYGDKIYISLMNQYTPMPGIEEKYPELGRKVTPKEYDRLVDYAIELGVENGFIQEGETASESFIPDFNYEGV
ncbi:MAG: radical SAM protein [Butyrivibrio sp.]